MTQKQNIANNCCEQTGWIAISWIVHKNIGPQAIMNSSSQYPTGRILSSTDSRYFSERPFGAWDSSINSLGVAAPQAGQA